VKTVYDLMCEVARHLTGKAVRVRITRPDDAYGLAWCDELGRSTIDISPDLTDDQMIYVFLHELGHIRHQKFTPVAEDVMARSSLPLAKASYQAREGQADRQAKDWLEYGKRYRDRSLPDLEGILTALLTYYI